VLRTTLVMVVAVIASAFVTPVASASTITSDGLGLRTTISNDGSPMRTGPGWNYAQILIADKGDEFVMDCYRIGSDWGSIWWAGTFEDGRAGWFDSRNLQGSQPFEPHCE
jgi:uncharacterized protein YraI